MRSCPRVSILDSANSPRPFAKRRKRGFNTMPPGNENACRLSSRVGLEPELQFHQYPDHDAIIACMAAGVFAT